MKTVHLVRQRAGLFMAGLFALLLGMGLVACGDAGTSDKNQAKLRLVNATGATGGYSQLSLYLNDVLQQGQVAYGDNALYATVDDGNTTLAISAQSSTTRLHSSSVSLGKDRYYTSLAFGRAGALRQVLLDDNQAEPDANKSLLRVVHAAPDNGALDVYLIGAEENLATAVALQSSASYGAVGDWKTLNSAGWRLVVTAAGNRNDVRLNQSGLNLASRQISTLVLTASSGGVLNNAVLLNQRSATVVRLDNAEARVRVAAGLDGAGAVTVTVGGAPLVMGAASPSIGNYANSLAPSAATELTVAGTVRRIEGGTVPAAGADFTLLVLGSTDAAAVQAGAMAPKGVWLPDLDSGLSNSTQARIRLVNGLSDAATRLSLAVDFVPLSGGIAAGSASASYADTPPGTTIGLRVTRESDSAVMFQASGLTLAANATYSVFVLGSPGAPVGVVRRDR